MMFIHSPLLSVYDIVGAKLRDNYLNEFVQVFLLTDVVVNSNLLLLRNNCSLRKNLITQSAGDILIKVCKLLQH